MRHLFKTTMTLGLLLAVSGLWQNSEATPAKPIFNLKIEAKSTPNPVVPGPIQYEIRITPLADCDEVTLRLDTVDNLGYNGPLLLSQPVSKLETAVFTLNLEIPANDTSGIKFNVACGKERLNLQTYWVTLPDSVEQHSMNPRLYLRVLQRGKKPRIIWPDDSLRKEQEKRRQESIKVDYYDGQGNLVPEGKYKISPEKLEKLRELGKRRSEPSKLDPNKIYVSDKEGNIRLVDRQWWYDSLENVKRQRDRMKRCASWRRHR